VIRQTTPEQGRTPFTAPLGWALNAFDAMLCSLVLRFSGRSKTTAGGFSGERPPDLQRRRQQVSQLSRIVPSQTAGAVAVLLKDFGNYAGRSSACRSPCRNRERGRPLLLCLVHQYRARFCGTRGSVPAALLHGIDDQGFAFQGASFW